MIESNRYLWSHLKTKTVTVRVEPKRVQRGVVFRVRNMIDLGSGRQTVMLEHVDYPVSYGAREASRDVPVPFQMGQFDFVYTSRKKPVMQSVNHILDTLFEKDDVQSIVTDVLAPGDLLVFKQEGSTMNITLSQTLRVVANHENTASKIDHAL